MTATKVEIRGIRELVSALKKVDGEIPGFLKSKLLAVAENVVGKARSKVPRISGRAAASIKPRATTRGASIAFGGTAAEYMPWLNFGGRVGRGGSIVRERIEPDRYIYSTISEAKGETEDAIEEAVKKAAHRADFETRGL